MLLTEGISCALKAVCSDGIEFQKHHKWVAEYVEAKDQCLVQDEIISRRLDLSVLQKKSVAQIPQSTVSANRIHEKVELMDYGYDTITIQSPFFLYIICMLLTILCEPRATPLEPFKKKKQNC